MRCLLRHLALEPAALLDGVGQLAEAVGEFDAAGIELEALGDARDPRAGRASAACAAGIFVENGGAADAEIALDPSPPARG